jgi:DNA-binding YbaB/EbfC family protein
MKNLRLKQRRHDDMAGLGDMFKGMSQFASLMKNLPMIKEQMLQLQQRVGQIIADGDAGAGMVKVRFNGRMEMIACTLSDDALKLNDREMLEDLIKAATNQALTKARQQVAEETSKMTADLGVALPEGMNLPGLS